MSVWMTVALTLSTGGGFAGTADQELQEARASLALAEAGYARVDAQIREFMAKAPDPATRPLEAEEVLIELEEMRLDYADSVAAQRELVTNLTTVASVALTDDSLSFTGVGGDVSEVDAEQLAPPDRKPTLAERMEILNAESVEIQRTERANLAETRRTFADPVARQRTLAALQAQQDRRHEQIDRAYERARDRLGRERGRRNAYIELEPPPGYEARRQAGAKRKSAPVVAAPIPTARSRAQLADAYLRLAGTTKDPEQQAYFLRRAQELSPPSSR